MSAEVANQETVATPVASAATHESAGSPTREPIFIVGVSRSGTTLLAAMLNAHSRISCGPETFFFPRLARQPVDEVVGDPAWPNRATAFLTSMRLGGSDVKIHDLFTRTEAEISADLSAASPSVPAMLDALAGARARTEGKPRWAEKTPNHLLFLDDIRRYYPRAPIVRIVRDPRDVALSLTKVPFGSKSKLANLYLWLERDERSWRFFETDAHSVTVRYEDLLAEPEQELRRICETIGEPYEPAMLSPSAGAAGMIAPEEWWKHQVLRPLDRSRASAWVAKYSPPEREVADVLCREALRRYRYPHTPGATRVIKVLPFNQTMIEQNEDILAAAAARNVVFHRARWDELRLWPNDQSPTVVFWGDLRRIALALGTTVTGRVRNVARLVAHLVLQPVHGRVLRTDARSEEQKRPGKLDVVCGTLICLLAQRVQPSRLFDRGARRDS